MKFRQYLSLSGHLILASIFTLTGCSNIYTPLANKLTDEARYEDAMKFLNKGEYDAAATEFEALSPAFIANSQVRQYYASALAGKCGYNFAGFITYLSTADFSTSPFFKNLMNQFTGRVTRPEFCTAAEAQIKTIWLTENPTASQQLFVVILSMSKIGAYLRVKGDLNGTDNLGDDTPDVGFNVCNSSASNMTDDEVKEVVTGFSLMLLNIGGFLGSMSGDTATVISTINTGCGLLSPNPCSTTEAGNVTAPMVASMRDLLNTSATHPALPIGIGACVDPDVTACCP